MNRTIPVYLGTRPRLVGELRYEAQGARERSAFAYDASWLAAVEHFALGPSLPLVTGPQFSKKTAEGSVFPGAIADTEPDGWGRRVILRDHAKRRQAARRAGREVSVAPLNAVDYLLAVDDFSRVGALRFKDESGVFQRSAEDGRPSAPPLIELGHLLAATRAVEMNRETAADLAYLRGRGTSLGGLRPKCTVVDDAGQLSIGKFPSVSDERAVTKAEVLAMRLARAAGINAAEAQIVQSDGIPVALIRRFDRDKIGARLMYVSAATLVGVDPSGEHAYTQIVDALRIHGAAAQPDIEELWRRIAFSIMVNNVDDHLRNHGFLHVAQGQWRLAPAFDLNPFPDRARELKTWISEEAGPEATIAGLMSVIAYFRISPTRAKQMLRKVERAVAKWGTVGRALGMSTTEMDPFTEAFEHSERVAARSAAG